MNGNEDLLRSARQATEGEHQDDYGADDLRRLVSSLADALEPYRSPAHVVRAALWIAAEQPHNSETLPAALRTAAEGLFGVELVSEALNA